MTKLLIFRSFRFIKRFFLFFALVLASLHLHSQRNEWKQLNKDLKNQDKQKGHKVYWITLKDSGLIIRFQFFRTDNTLAAVMIGGTHGDTITMYRYLGKDIAIMNRGRFKSIYAAFYFKQGKLIHSVEHKGWHIENLDSYIDKAKAYQKQSLLIKIGT